METLQSIRDVEQLEDMLSQPSAAALEALRNVSGDVLLLGAGGKMGTSLARMIVRGSEQVGVARRVLAVSRFGKSGLQDKFHQFGAETIAGDLLDEDFVNNLPDAENVIFMTGVKFGTSGDASLTWAMNTWVPTLVGQRFRNSRIVSFSTGNVYPFVPIESGGCKETDAPNPVGEYGMSALGRERMFQYFSQRHDIPTAIVRLNYSVEMRYGVLVDLCRQVLNNQTIDVSTGYANVIWQADANAMTIAAMQDTDVPPFIVNVTGPELVSIREASMLFGEILGKTPQIVGDESKTALLNNANQAIQRYGAPRYSVEQIIRWTADWVARGGETLDKPTQFQVRDGQF
ncbi:MAG: nucleoside-diphosphate-sugar epimerase [Pirellulaceae bacterium]|jgi:nucleoside-diphosphate-sugar epimerase